MTLESVVLDKDVGPQARQQLRRGLRTCVCCKWVTRGYVVVRYQVVGVLSEVYLVVRYSLVYFRDCRERGVG